MSQYSAELSASQIVESIASQNPHRREGEGIKIACPAHNGDGLNCYVGVGDGDGVVAKCWSHECSYKDILDALGIPQPHREAYYKCTYTTRRGKSRNTYRNEKNPKRKTWGKGSSKDCRLLNWNTGDTPDHILVLVEGEKAAEALQSHKLKGISPVSWRGGCKVAHLVDTSAVDGRNVILWPDDDTAGRDAMEVLTSKCWDSGAKAIKIIPTDGETKNDAADYDRAQIVSILKTKQPVEYEPKWQLTQTGGIRSSSVLNAEWAAETVTGTVRLNDFTGAVEVDGQPITDGDRSWILRSVEEKWEYSPGVEAMRSGIDNLARQNRYDPIRDWLDNLVWDGEPRLYHMATRYFNYPDNQYSEYMNQVAALLVRGIVARQYWPGAQYDYCVVLRSESEGTGKSSALRVLAGGPEFYTGSFTLDSFDLTKTTLEKSAGKLVVVSEELAGLKRSENAKVKGVVTDTSDTSRLTYRRDGETVHRRFIFAATTNETYIIPDQNSVRRYPVLECMGGVDLGALETDRDQVFAEAVRQRVEHVVLPKQCQEMQQALAQHYIAPSALKEWFDDTLAHLQSQFPDRPLAIQRQLFRDEAKRSVGRISNFEWGTLLRSAKFRVGKFQKQDELGNTVPVMVWQQPGDNPALCESGNFN